MLVNSRDREALAASVKFYNICLNQRGSGDDLRSYGVNIRHFVCSGFWVSILLFSISLCEYTRYASLRVFFSVYTKVIVSATLVTQLQTHTIFVELLSPPFKLQFQTSDLMTLGIPVKKSAQPNCWWVAGIFTKSFSLTFQWNWWQLWRLWKHTTAKISASRSTMWEKAANWI